jgi:hypothetical protein
VDHLFTVRDPSLAKVLPEEQMMAFHCTAAQLLFLSARVRRDIQPATAFLTTRVRSPDENDWGKVKRVLSYLKGTLHMPLILSADSLILSRWWVDAAYTVHNNCWGHTGAGMSFGQGMALSYSWKQKINTKSSTEAELVGVDDSLGYILWAHYFMIKQGYDMDPSLLYQDNMSAILLEPYGRATSSKRAKHIKVKYFLIKDKVDQEEITIKHCPTEQMWTDINTNVKRYLINYPHLFDYGQTICCLSFPSRDRATAPGRYEQFYFTEHVPYPQKIHFKDAIRSEDPVQLFCNSFCVQHKMVGDD